MYEVSLDDIGPVPIAKVAPEQRLVFGWLYVAVDAEGRQVVDHSQTFVPPEAASAFERAAYEYVLTARVAGEMHDRECIACGANVTLQDAEPGAPCPTCGGMTKPRQVGRLVESLVITPEKRAALGLPDGVLPQLAWWVGFRVDDDAVWQGVKSGKYRAFSFSGPIAKRRA